MDELLDFLAQSEYWNWFDTRLLEALTYATGSPEAIKCLENFKKTYYNRKISELIPCVFIKPLTEFTVLEEKFDRHPKDLTVFDLLQHKYKLEKEVLDLDEGDLALVGIKTGCIELRWLIPPELVYQAYSSMQRKHDELPSKLIKSLVCAAADEFSGLPILWRGQEVGEIGPIEPLPEHVRQQAYSLPKGFHWVTLIGCDVEEFVKFMNINENVSTDSTMFYHYTTHPHTRSEWQFGIKTTYGELVGAVLAYPVCMIIRGISLTFLCPKIICHKKYRKKRLWYILCKELMRRANLNKINQLLLGFKHSFLKPVTMITTWVCSVFHPLLFSSYQTSGWREIMSKDVPGALALVNNYLSQFEIKQFFTSEEEFCHHFVNQSVPKSVYTYVVVSQNSITDLVSYRFLHNHDRPSRVTTIILVSTRTPIKDLIIDTIISARNNGAISLSILQRDLQVDTLLSLSFVQQFSTQRCLYNYKYHEVSEDKFWCAD